MPLIQLKIVEFRFYCVKLLFHVLEKYKKCLQIKYKYAKKLTQDIFIGS